ncbi:MAG: methionyl-tRNA formyltransferase, partial [Phoenicibacter congonensis]|nr:methionyl-tRNA formyltransferase [Phoenicibacter congonensis]
MRVLFMGTPNFARIILSKLIESEHDVCAVFTKQDAVSKRGNKLIPSEVKSLCLEAGVDVFTPATLKDEAVQDQIKELNPDVICVAAYGKILPKAVLEAPKFGCINVHASLLPRWRGAAPIERGILAGDESQGVSIMQMEEGLDTGDYCKQVAIDAVGKNAVQLTCELAEAGAAALIDCLNDLEAGKPVDWIQQDESQVTYAEKIDKHELSLNESDSAAENVQRVLASADS